MPEIVGEFNVDTLTVHDGLVVTARSTVKLLRDVCRWYGVFSSWIERPHVRTMQKQLMKDST